MIGEDGEIPRRDRLRIALERLLALDAVALGSALDQAAPTVAEALGADKVDAFVYEAETDSLVARGTSDTLMGRKQRALGLDRLPLADGGRAAEAFRIGRPHLDGRVDNDPGELEGIRVGLGLRSQMLCPFDVAGERRGVLSAVGARPEQFSEDHLRFLEAVAGWLGLVMHRAELVQKFAGHAEARGRREAIGKLLEALTPRQREVAALIGSGRSNAEIAEELVLVRGTVANHVERILGRLAVRSRTEVAVLIAQAGTQRPSPDGPESAP